VPADDVNIIIIIIAIIFISSQVTDTIENSPVAYSQIYRHPHADRQTDKHRHAGVEE